MKPRIVPVLIVLSTLVVARPAPAASRYSERSDREADARGLRVLEVDNPRGDILVTPSADGRLHVTALKTCRGRDAAEARRHATEIDVSASRQGDRYAIRVTYPPRVDIRINFWELVLGDHDEENVGPSHELDLQVQVPEALDVRLVSASGDVVTRGLAGRQSLGTTSGDCAVGGAKGVVEIRTVSGDARLEGARRASVHSTSGDIEAVPGGPLEAESTSGDIDVEQAPDSLVLGSTSGDISVDGAPRGLEARTGSGTIGARAVAGTVSVHATSGSVDLALVAPLASADLASSSGDLEVSLGSGLGARLELASRTGDIDCDVPVRILEQGRRNLIANYGRGGATVKARTDSGDLHVTSGGR